MKSVTKFCRKNIEFIGVKDQAMDWRARGSRQGSGPWPFILQKAQTGSGAYTPSYSVGNVVLSLW